MRHPKFPESPDSPTARDLDFRWTDLLAVIARHRLLFAGVFLAGMVLATAVAVVRPPYYRSTAKLLVEPNVVHMPVTPGADQSLVGFRHADSRGTEAEINATVAMLTRLPLIRQVIEENEGEAYSAARPSLVSRCAAYVRTALGLPELLYRKVHGIRDGGALDRAARLTRMRLAVKPIERANVIEVSYRDRDPQWAARFLNGLLEVYLSNNARSGEERERLEFLQEQRSLYERKHRAAQEELRAFHAGPASSIPFDEEEGLRVFRDELLRIEATTEVELAGVEARLASLEEEYGSLDKSIPVDALVAGIHPIDELAARVGERELERSELVNRYKPSSVVVKAIDADIQMAKQLLEKERAAAASALVRSGPASQELALQLVQTRVERSQLRARLTALSAELDQVAQRFTHLDSAAAELARLEAGKAAAETAYATYLAKEEQARFVLDLNHAGITNQVIAERAEVPGEPEPSAAARILLVGLLLSGFAASVVVLWVDRRSIAMRDERDATESLADIPLVGLVGLDEEDDYPFDEQPQRRPYDDRARPVLRLLTYGVLAAGISFAATGIILGVSRTSSLEAAVAATETPPHIPSPPAAVAASEIVDLVIAATRPSMIEAEPEPHPIEIGTVEELGPMAAAGIAIEPDLEPNAPPTPPHGRENVEPPTQPAVRVHGAPSAPRVERNERVVVVGKGMTFYSLVVDAYGEYTPERVADVKRANPTLEEPSRIAVGSTLRFPDARTPRDVAAGARP